MLSSDLEAINIWGISDQFALHTLRVEVKGKACLRGMETICKVNCFNQIKTSPLFLHTKA